MPQFTIRWTNRSNVAQDWTIYPINDNFTLQPDYSRPVNININHDYVYQISVDVDGNNQFRTAAATLQYTAATNQWTLFSNTPNEFTLDVNGQTVRVTCHLALEGELISIPDYDAAEPTASGGASGGTAAIARAEAGPAPTPLSVTAKELPTKNVEVTKYFTFNETGNIMISTTEQDQKEFNPIVMSEFQEVAVFFAALTKVLDDSGKNLYSYEAINNIITNSGLFILVDEEYVSFKQSSSTMTFNTEILAALLGIAATEGAGLIIAQQVLSSIGRQATINVSSSSGEKKVGHLLFVCEYLMGMPLVSVQFFNLDSKQAADVFKIGPCASGSHYSESILLNKATYMFVIPKYIKEYSADLVSGMTDKDFGALIDLLKKALKPSH